jgi:deoxyribonuclease-1
VTPWEKERNKRITAIMGHPNPFVTNDSSWTKGYKTVGDGVLSALPANSTQSPKPIVATRSTTAWDIIGNSKSHVYHLPEGCPSYDKVSSKNQMTFDSESADQSAGYHKGGNCK